MDTTKQRIHISGEGSQDRPEVRAQLADAINHTLAGPPSTTPTIVLGPRPKRTIDPDVLAVAFKEILGIQAAALGVSTENVQPDQTPTPAPTGQTHRAGQ